MTPTVSGEELHRAPGEKRIFDLQAERAKIDEVTDEVGRIRDRQVSVQREIDSLSEILKQIKAYGFELSRTGAGGAYSFIRLRMGVLSNSQLEVLRDELRQTPAVAIPMTL